MTEQSSFSKSPEERLGAGLELKLPTISELPALITVFTAVVLCMSVVHSVVYFWYIGVEFEGFMSTSDYNPRFNLLGTIAIRVYANFIFIWTVVRIYYRFYPGILSNDHR
jgi:hypothetical protein